MTASQYFSKEEEASIIAAITAAEKNTSGEIRVHLDMSCEGDPLERATALFGELNMHETAQRNGVLIFVAIQDRKLAIVGDEGIDRVVPANFWDVVRDTMIAQFKNDAFAEGLCSGIILAGEQLKAHFPLLDDDQNELNNELSFGDETEI